MVILSVTFSDVETVLRRLNSTVDLSDTTATAVLFETATTSP
jgi:hypothetical protein